MGPHNKVIIFFYYSYIQVEVRNLGGVILLALRARVSIHPSIIHSNTIIEICNLVFGHEQTQRNNRGRVKM